MNTRVLHNMQYVVYAISYAYVTMCLHLVILITYMLHNYNMFTRTIVRGNLILDEYPSWSMTDICPLLKQMSKL